MLHQLLTKNLVKDVFKLYVNAYKNNVNHLNIKLTATEFEKPANALCLFQQQLINEACQNIANEEFAL